MSTEWFSPGLLSWMWCPIQATCYLVPENNHDKLHLRYGKQGKAIGLHSGTAGHVTAEVLVKARNCSARLPWEWFWVTGVVPLVPGCFRDPRLRAVRNSCKCAGA